FEAVVKARVQRAVAAEREALAEFGQADEDEREQRAAVPGVIEQDVQVVERVLMQEMALVEEKHGVDALGGAFLDVAAERVEQAAGGGGRGDTDGTTQLTVEGGAARRGGVVGGEAGTR